MGSVIGQRILVKIRLSIQRKAGQHSVVKSVFQQVGKASFAVQGKHPVVPHHAADSRASFGIGPFGGQFVIAAKSFVIPARTDAPGNIELYAEASLETELPSGQAVRLTTRTRYPWDSMVEIEVESAGDFGVFLRIPAWCEEGSSLEVTGESYIKPPVAGSYLEIRREWQAGDKINLRLPMPVRRLEAHPYSPDTNGRVALMRGPLLYCVEQADNPGIDLRDLVVTDATEFSAQLEPDLLNKVVVLRGHATVVPPDPTWQRRLYRSQEAAVNSPVLHTVGLTAIPYYAWANREPGQMLVWLRNR